MFEEHHHEHNNTITRLTRAFTWGIVLNILFVIIELGTGIIVNSMALISDAGHNLIDVASLALSLFAFKLMQVKPSEKYTYGYKKSTILVTLVNGCALLVVVGVVIAESIHKIANPQPIEGNVIAWVAGVGIIINAFTAWLFMKDKKRDINVKGAYLHMIADTLVSVGVLVSGIAISLTGWSIIDPLIGIVIAVVIFLSTYSLFKTSLRLSLDGVPEGINLNDIKNIILKSETHIIDIHHIHIWAISTTENAFTAHIVVNSQENNEDIKHKIKNILEKYNIQHITLEFELESEKCSTSLNGSCF
ncbi:MAG: cation diffusion facilitator family transporter [Bacteroidales bacterium]|jgi:cobalt-zinc-cadmium efflux system protein